MTDSASTRWQRWRRRAPWLALLLLVAWFGGGLAAAWRATQPWPSPIAARADIAGFPVHDVQTTTSDGLTVRGWFVPRPDARGCVVLAAGVRGNRTGMATRAAFHLEHGWSTLLIDLRGTGASDRARIAMGWHEADDLLAWHAWLRARDCRCIAVHGQSLGAAAAVYAAQRGVAWDFAVLEACYRDIHAALAARLAFVPAPLLWPMVLSAEWLLGLDADQLAPGRAIAALHCPVLFVHGERDAKVGPDALSTLMANCPSPAQTSCVVPEAGHVDLWHADRPRVAAALDAFLQARR